MEEPVVEEPVDEEPVVEEPVVEEPVVEEPVDEEPVDEEPVDEEPEEIPAVELAELLAAHESGTPLIIERDVAVTADTALPMELELELRSGTLKVKEGAALSNDGLMTVTGGVLTVEPGAELINDGFINVVVAGALTVEPEGLYSVGEFGFLCLNNAAADAAASITGVDPANIDLTVYADSADALSAALSVDGYAFLTVCVPDPAVADALDMGALPQGKAVSVIRVR